MECTLVAATCKCLRTKAYIQQRFLCSMWNARVISTATSQLKAGRLSKNKIYSYLCWRYTICLSPLVVSAKTAWFHAKCYPGNHLLLRLCGITWTSIVWLGVPRGNLVCITGWTCTKFSYWTSENGRLASFKRGGPFHEHIPKGTG